MFVPEPEFRAPTEIERHLLERLLEADFPGRDELAPLVRNVLVRTVTGDSGLELKSQIEGRADVNQRVPIEAEAAEGDGGEGPSADIVHMLLHVRDGRPVELEFYKNNGATVKKLPPPSAFELIVLPPPPKNGWPFYGKRT